MGLIDTIKEIFTGSKTQKRGFYEAMQSVSLRGQQTGGMLVSDESALNFSAVWAAIRILSESVAQLPLSVFEIDKNGNKKPSSTHQLYNLLHRKPNEMMTTYTFIQKCMYDLLTRGNSFVFINRNKSGRPIELLPIDPTKIKLVQNDGKLFYELEEGGIIDSYDLLHFKILSKDGLIGYSPIDVGAASIGYGLSLQTYANSYFANSAKASGVLSTDRHLSDEAISRLRTSFNENYSNIQDANKTMVLEEGLKFQQISISNEASQFLQSREFSISEIARLMNLPNHLLRDLTKSSFNNIAEEGQNFVKYSLMPYLVMMESEMNCKLFRKNEEGRFSCKFNVNAMLRGTPKDRSEYYRTMLNIGAMSIDEIRQLEEMPTIDGGDSHFMQLNMATLSDIIDGGTLQNNSNE